ncbi:MAG: divergent polysaccharide deacetylase family protein [Gammaproteobacteria bacterium]|nr:divergent polysaccharide deacetylase family protein [Gammaproteobacteria bacterium]
MPVPLPLSRLRSGLRCFLHGVLFGTLLLGGIAQADERPVIALIIDDIGDRLPEGQRAVELPGAVTYAILPHTPFARRLAKLGHAQGKEIMLHQPMQALNGEKMGPGGIHLDMDRQQLQQVLRDNLAAIPHVRGVNNHMGSLLTRHPGHMAWVMEALQQQGGLYFVDSTTAPTTVAQKVAREHGLANARRHVFLDHDREREAILKQFVRLLEQAHQNGAALAIGHPYPETLDVLEALLPYLDEFGVRLLPVSAWIVQAQHQRETLWQASLSPSPRAAKSSKR